MPLAWMWVILNLQANMASLKSCMQGFLIPSRSLSLKVPNKGLWSVDMSKSVQPKGNIRECWRPQATGRGSVASSTVFLVLGGTLSKWKGGSV